MIDAALAERERNELDLVRLVLSAHQNAYARFHCTEKRRVIESHEMAIGYASVELAKALKPLLVACALQQAEAAYWLWKDSHEDFGANQQKVIDGLRKSS